jgi:hypothetical protein
MHPRLVEEAGGILDALLPDDTGEATRATLATIVTGMAEATKSAAIQPRGMARRPRRGPREGEISDRMPLRLRDPEAELAQVNDVAVEEDRNAEQLGTLAAWDAKLCNGKVIA